MPDLQDLITTISDLPTLPDVVARVNQMVNDPDASAADINDVISQDISLSAKILKLVNSPFYGFPRRITTITYAVVILGFNTVRNLALSAFIFDAFKKKGAREFDLRGFWRHSVCTAIASQATAARTGLWQEEDAFMGGLLHGVGKVVMNQHMADDVKRIMEHVRKEDCLFCEAEAALLDYTHNEVGALLLDRWNLPDAIIEATRHHHTPSKAAEAAPLCALVHFADILSRSLCAGFPGDWKIPRLAPEVWGQLALSWDDVGALMDQVGQEYNRAGAFFEL